MPRTVLLEGPTDQVALFWVLRSQLAEPIESLLLLDRAAYLTEQGFDVDIVPLFDPTVSPRNCAIIAVRQSA